MPANWIGIPEVAARIAAGLAEASDNLRVIEDILSAGLELSCRASHDLMRLQALDRVIQMLGDYARVLDRLSQIEPGETQIAADALFGPARLGAVRAGGRTSPSASDAVCAAGDIDWF